MEKHLYEILYSTDWHDGRIMIVIAEGLKEAREIFDKFVGEAGYGWEYESIMEIDDNYYVV